MNTGRLAGLFYLGTFVTGLVALTTGVGIVTANAVAALCYVGVTVLFYVLFRPVSPVLSAVAAAFSAIGCVLSLLRGLHVLRPPVSELAFFGCYCILIGYLIYVSRLVPRVIGVLMMIGGVSWLTFGWVPLAHALSPYNYAPGILAEGLLTIWLVAFGTRSTRIGQA